MLTLSPQLVAHDLQNPLLSNNGISSAAGGATSSAAGGATSSAAGGATSSAARCMTSGAVRGPTSSAVVTYTGPDENDVACRMGTVRMTNVEVTHEMLLDSDFKFGDEVCIILRYE